MSHEIRTPLNAVLGFAHIGLRDSVGRADQKTFRRIRDAGEHLLRVINDVLDFSKLDAGKLAIECRPFHLGMTLAKVSSLVTDSAREKGLAYSQSVAPDLPKWVVGDAFRLQQILANLLSNAVKFTERGEVRMHVTREGGMTQFTVVDTGIGMSSEQVARLFRPFEQADSSITRKYGGTGLGLAISRDLAHLMNGEIAVQSAPGHGAVFTLNLALPAVEPDLPARAEAPHEHRLKGIRVLVVEDVEVNRLVMEQLLGNEGAQVTLAEHGRQALERLEEMGATAFDVVLMDVQMPEMDGFEATRLILELTPGLPVIGLTAHALAEERQHCLDAGMVEHIAKPVDPEKLVTSIRSQLERARNAWRIGVA